MTKTASRTIANVLLGAAGALAAYYVLRDPRLRRTALRALRIGVTRTIPAYLVGEATTAWRESGRRAA